MPNRAVQAFMDGLHAMEESRELQALVSMFAERCELESPARGVRFEGRDGARRFWSDYLSAFEDVHSVFTRVTEGGNSAAREWRSDAHPAGGGTPLSYRGVSLIEFDDEGHVARFCTYYDSAAFLPSGAKHTLEVETH